MGQKENSTQPDTSVPFMTPREISDTTFYYFDAHREVLEDSSKRLVAESGAEEILRTVCDEIIAPVSPDVVVQKGLPVRGLANVWARWNIDKPDESALVSFSAVTVYGLPLEDQLLIVNGNGGQIISREQWSDREILTEVIRSVVTSPQQDMKFGSFDAK